ncbi:PREDICTED: zinc finger MYM-type protein 1-like [Ipomoea nil]|uniref:zinc finger MYM-type protein 1-like n=1 Tax=Ipomoea nil TaxID=35883 RepID=UPI00090098E1|nr:PREDICTED: zinc finger MYM-type protein 1-like [Ipomoea nil]
MKKTQRIDLFFRKNYEDSTSQVNPYASIEPLNFESRPEKSQRVEIIEKFDIQSLERDSGLRLLIWKCPIDKRDEVRRAYIKVDPYQCLLSKYPKSREKHPRSFQTSWFKLFPSWLEYSPSKDVAFCLPCYLFHTKDGLFGLDAFTINGFRSWKKVRDGKNCSFLAQIGKDFTSPHRNAEKACADLMNQQLHIAQHIEKFTSQEIVENRLRLRTSIEATRWLSFQGCSFRGHDKSITSMNHGNFLELLSFIAFFNGEVTKVLDKAPRNASYTSPTIQKQILQVLATKVKSAIQEEIEIGFIQDRFFGVVHVKDTSASTLKEGIFSILSRHNLDVQNIRGQGYDGTSNMRGEWNGLKDLILDEYPYAYYVHCFAHRLQLTLVASSKEVILVHQFFTKLNSIINVVGASCKRNDQLKAAHASNIVHLLSIDELESGRGLNQIVLLNIIEDGTTRAHHGDADAAYELQELRNRFDDKAMELIILSSSLDSKEMRISFRLDDICKLVEKFYPQDFEDYEILQLRMQL